jgi:cyclophilin family peptidyl-prolyl cis-trans isomerase
MAKSLRLLIPAWILTTTLSLGWLASASWSQEPGAPPTQDAPAPDTQDAPDPTPQDAPPPPNQDAPAAPAQDAPAPPTSDATVAAPPAPDAGTPDGLQRARAKYNAVFGEWKATFKQLRTLQHDYQLADEATRASMEQQWNDAIAKAKALLPAVTDAALELYLAAPNEDRAVTAFLVKKMEDDLTADRYEDAAKIADVLMDNYSDLPQVYQAAASAHFALSHLDKCREILDKAEAEGAAGQDVATLRKDVEDYTEYWKREQELRQQEAAADDLPRVKLTTSKGDILLELFENEAPETVGNFISLVKKGFYDGLPFHRVLPGFMAQTGCPNGDGTGDPGYSIYDECDKPDARMHFRGSLSMAKKNTPDSGGSQFFITFRPTPHLNKQHTVFGRVLEGMDVVTQIQRRDPSGEAPPEPDTIIKAEVVRDRGHDNYVPHKVQ